jgi:hypothetical protein
MLYAPLADGTWHSLILAFFVSAVVMPHMYHMAFTEKPQSARIAHCQLGHAAVVAGHEFDGALHSLGSAENHAGH